MTSDEPIRIRVGMAVSYIAGSTREGIEEGPPRSEWDAMTEEERENYLSDLSQVMVSNHLDAWAYVDEEE